MATSITSPKLSNAIRNDVPAINTILKALAKSDPSVLADIENGTKRLYQGTNGWEFQELQSGSWVTLKSFNIDAKSVDGKTLSTGATANAIAVRDASGKLAGDITGNAATATTATALASTLAVAAGGTGATTASAARTNLGVPPTSHASTGTSYGVSTADNYGHAKASATTPKALGTASAGSETSSFARGDHVHPTTTATGSVLGMVKLSDATNSTSAASAGVAASPAAVKAAYDLANGISATANAAYSASNITKAINPITSTIDDTTVNWATLGPGVYWFSQTGCLIDQPSQYGFLVNYVMGSDVFQMWSSQAGGPVRFRQGYVSGWGNTWQNSATWADSCNWANGADSSNVANTLNLGGNRVAFNWSGQGGQPTWVWGGNDLSGMYVYNPSNFNVNYANSTWYADNAGRLSTARAITIELKGDSDNDNPSSGTLWFDGTGNVSMTIPYYYYISGGSDMACGGN